MRLTLAAGAAGALAGLAGLIGGLGAPAVAVATASDDFAQVDAYLDAYAAKNDLPGLAAAVIGPDGVEHEYLQGADGNGEPVTADTPFLIGSIAKSMTATVVMQLEKQGELSLQDHVSDFIDFFPHADPSIGQLLTHTAGFSSADGIAAADRHDNEPGAIRRAVESLQHSGTIGTYAYTSADYLVLGAIVEAVTGRPYADALATDLLEPLGMRSSGATEQAADHLPAGHRFWWGRSVRFDPDFDESGGPYASVVSTLTDMEAYATAQLGGQPDDQAAGSGIPGSIRQQMQQPHVKSSNDHYGFGWSITDVDGEPIVHHTGATPGYFAHVYLVPGQNRAIVLLANAYSEARAPSLAAGAGDIWRILAGEDQQPAGFDTLLTAMPWILTAVAILGIALAAVAPLRPKRRTRRYAAAALCLLVVITLWFLPGFFGYDLRALRIWMPDAAWALIASLGTWTLAAISHLIPAFRPAHRPTVWRRKGLGVDSRH